MAINDSIVVLSHLNEDAGTGKISKHKLIETTIRSTRHIVTTSLTTMGGLLPLLFDKFFETLAKVSKNLSNSNGSNPPMVVSEVVTI